MLPILSWQINGEESGEDSWNDDSDDEEIFSPGRDLTAADDKFCDIFRKKKEIFHERIVCSWNIMP